MRVCCGSQGNLVHVGECECIKSSSAVVTHTVTHTHMYTLTPSFSKHIIILCKSVVVHSVTWSMLEDVSA